MHFSKYSFAYKVNYLICKTTGAFLANFGYFQDLRERLLEIDYCAQKNYNIFTEVY
jgi:hypothetical protein